MDRDSVDDVSTALRYYEPRLFVHAIVIESMRTEHPLRVPLCVPRHKLDTSQTLGQHRHTPVPVSTFASSGRHKVAWQSRRRIMLGLSGCCTQTHRVKEDPRRRTMSLDGSLCTLSDTRQRYQVFPVEDGFGQTKRARGKDRVYKEASFRYILSLIYRV